MVEDDEEEEEKEGKKAEEYRMECTFPETDRCITEGLDLFDEIMGLDTDTSSATYIMKIIKAWQESLGKISEAQIKESRQVRREYVSMRHDWFQMRDEGCAREDMVPKDEVTQLRKDNEEMNEEAEEFREEIKLLKEEVEKCEEEKEELKRSNENLKRLLAISKEETNSRPSCTKLINAEAWRDKYHNDLKEALARIKTLEEKLEERAEEERKREEEEKMEVDPPSPPELSMSAVVSWHVAPVAPPPPPTPPPPPPPASTKTYAQAATQTPPTATTTTTTITTTPEKPASLLGRFAFAEDMSGYEKEEEKVGCRARREKPSPQPFQARAVVIHAIPTNWNLEWVKYKIEKEKGENGVEIVGIRWLLNQQRRQGKRTSSVVVYLSQEVKMTGLPVRLGGGKHVVVPYDFDRK